MESGLNKYSILEQTERIENAKYLSDDVKEICINRLKSGDIAGVRKILNITMIDYAHTKVDSTGEFLEWRDSLGI